jgi:hypothetical protein
MPIMNWEEADFINPAAYRGTPRTSLRRVDPGLSGALGVDGH